MRTRLNRLRLPDGDVAVAFFIGDTGESIIFGEQPTHVEVEADDYVPTNDCRFMVSGSILKTNTFREDLITTSTPFQTTHNAHWSRMTIQEDGTVGYCLDTFNTNHRMLAPHRLILGPNESTTLSILGFLSVAEGDIDIDGQPIVGDEIITLSGTPVTINAGSNGAQVGAIEIEYI
jgi:hypothetical protein